MKRIVRLTESDLTRIVRRVLNEGRGAEIAASFIKSLSGTLDDDEAGALNNVRLIKDKATLNEFMSAIQSKKGMAFCKYLNSEMSDVDSEYDQIVNHVSNLGGPNCFQGSALGTIKKRGTSAVQGFNWNFMDIP